MKREVGVRTGGGYNLHLLSTPPLLRKNVTLNLNVERWRRSNVGFHGSAEFMSVGLVFITTSCEVFVISPNFLVDQPSLDDPGAMKLYSVRVRGTGLCELTGTVDNLPHMSVCH